MFGRYKPAAWFDTISRYTRNHSPRLARRSLVRSLGAAAHPAFSLLEIMIVLAIIGLGLTVVIPRLSRGDNQFEELVASIQALTHVAYTNALVTGHIHRLFFDIEHNRIRIEKSTGKVNAQGKFDFEPLKISYVKTDFTLDDRFEIRHFVIQGKDEMSQAAGITTNEMWFFIMPEGLAQEVTMSIYDTLQDKEKTLVMNPFLAQLKVV